MGFLNDPMEFDYIYIYISLICFINGNLAIRIANSSNTAENMNCLNSLVIVPYSHYPCQSLNNYFNIWDKIEPRPA